VGVAITYDMLTLAYKNLQSNTIAADKSLKTGSCLCILGEYDDESKASCMILYTSAKPDKATGACGM